MDNEEHLLQAFNDAFRNEVDNYVLVNAIGRAGYNIINVERESMMIVENNEIADFFINRLLGLNVKVYSTTKEIPGWGTRQRKPPLDIFDIYADWNVTPPSE